MKNVRMLKRLSLISSLLIFVITASMIYVTHFMFVPAFHQYSNQPYLTGYLIGWGINMTLIFLASLFAYKLEGRSFSWEEFSKRYRLDRMEKIDWLWTLLVILVALFFYFGLSFTSEWLAKISVFSPHPSFPTDMVSGKLNPGYLFDMQLRGKWWVVAVYLIFWLLNIFGEEFWYRGWMLPRQELAFGNYAWIINGLMFTFQHWLQPWNFLAILPGALFAVYVVQRRHNTWITIIQHGLMNFSLLLYVFISVIG
jgi:membrane protease YdiL (CAAX protease family)